MGNSHKTIEGQMEDMENIGSAQLEHFGEVAIYQDLRQGRQVFRKDFTFLLQIDSSRQFLEKVRCYHSRNAHLIQPIRIFESDKNSSEMCSEVTRIVVIFEYLPITLRQLIVERQNTLFSEKKLWHFVMNLLEAVNALNENSNYHGDIFPDFIYFDRQKKILKIFDPIFFDTRKAGYHRVYGETAAYPSPEILSNLSEKRPVPQFNTLKTDIYSVGMCMLYCATLTDPIVAYNLKKLTIDSYHVQNLLRIAAINYSEKLVRTLRAMLGQKTRPTAKQFLIQLKPQSQQQLRSEQVSLTTSQASLRSHKAFRR